MPRIALLLHVYYPDLLDGLIRCARCFPAGTQLLVSTPAVHLKYVEAELRSALPDYPVECIAVPNLGRDIGPMLVAFAGRLKAFDLVCKLHTKKSPHQSEHHAWRETLLANLAGSPAVVQEITALFSANEHLGLYFPGASPALRPWMEQERGARDAAVRRLGGLPLAPDHAPDFPAGSMYWFRPATLEPLLEHDWQWEDFIDSGDTPGGGLAHGIERLVTSIAHCQGYTWIKRNLAGGARCSYEAFNREDATGIAVVLHAFDISAIMEAVTALKNLDFDFDLYVTCPAEHVPALRELLRLHFPHCRRRLLAVPNAGFDVAPFIALGERLLRYELVLKLHLKQQDDWRRYLFENLAGGIAEVNVILEMFRREADLGVVYPRAFPPVEKHLSWGSNHEIALGLARDLGIAPPPAEPGEFVSSIMFWCRPVAFTPLLSPANPISFDPAENHRRDGTTAHAIERMFLHVASGQGYRHRALLFHPYRGDPGLKLYP